MWRGELTQQFFLERLVADDVDLLDLGAVALHHVKLPATRYAPAGSGWT